MNLSMENSIQKSARTVLFKEGEAASVLYIVKSGEVVCLKSANNRLVPIFVAKAGDMIGENAMMADACNSYSAVSFTDVHLIAVPAENFLNVMNSAPEWLKELAVTMINRYESTVNLVAENRLIHPSILSEEQFPNSMEVEFKKLLN